MTHPVRARGTAGDSSAVCCRLPRFSSAARRPRAWTRPCSCPNSPSWRPCEPKIVETARWPGLLVPGKLMVVMSNSKPVEALLRRARSRPARSSARCRAFRGCASRATPLRTPPSLLSRYSSVIGLALRIAQCAVPVCPSRPAFSRSRARRRLSRSDCPAPSVRGRGIHRAEARAPGSCLARARAAPSLRRQGKPWASQSAVAEQ